MATALHIPDTLLAIRRALVNSKAVAASRPRVLLSQQAMGLPASAISAMLTRFLSPPDTPRTKSFPTLVFLVWLSPKTVMTTCIIFLMNA